MTNNKLENKVRESLSGLNFPPDPRGWERLEADLNRIPSGPKISLSAKQIRFSLNLIAGGLVLSGLIWAFVAYTPSSETGDKTKPAPVKEKGIYAPIPSDERNQFLNSSPENDAGASLSYVVREGGENSPGIAGDSYNPLSGNNNAIGANSGTAQKVNQSAINSGSSNTPVEPINPLLRGTIIADHPDLVERKKTLSEIKLSAEELQIFSNPNFIMGQRTLFFPDMIDPKLGYIYATREEDSSGKIMSLKEKLKQDSSGHKEQEPEINTQKNKSAQSDSLGQSPRKQEGGNSMQRVVPR